MQALSVSYHTMQIRRLVKRQPPGGGGHEVHRLGEITLCEVLQGFRRQSDFERAREALLASPIHETGGKETALRSAENYRALRRRGITVRKTIDCLIATYAFDHDLWLLHSDRDFDPFEAHLGLQVVR